ncbi:hypothetical protein KBB42_03440, partial [Candidatus Dojkabacteria bacterium]|nr:hypothetical protein [Candidatus Dojkabacteria bacterium]
MAKKKEIKKNALKYQDSESMMSKVEIKQPMPANQERISRLVGSVFIGLGVLLVAFGIFSYIKFREEPLLDPKLESPKLEEVTSITNGDKIKIKGLASGYDNVFIYLDEEKVGDVKVDDESKFSYEYTAEDEGEYKFYIAGVKGFPNRNISPKSEGMTGIIDKTGPDKNTVSLKYGEETNKETYIL